MKKTLQLICPICSHRFSVQHYSSYNLQEEGNLSKILDDSWIKHECPNCKREIIVIDAMVFHDMDKRLMLFYFPENSGSNESHDQLVRNYNYPSNYTIRIVEGRYNNFKEKILVLEYGMNDYAVEIYKLNIILSKYKMNDIYESHLLFNNSQPQGFVMYQKNGKPIIEKFDANEYETCARKALAITDSVRVHYSLIS
ncbi:MAG: CpXC domain-containing protein [Bacilli bacterium]|nr:CpXC domain-containing protein [Bacilli bacterium]